MNSHTAMDEAILAAAGDSWTKVAKVIVETARAVDGILPVEANRYEEIGLRVEGLVTQGRLEAQGNSKSWRYSEVRRAER